MKATISLDSILATLLPLSTRNKKWLADRLYANVREEESAAKTEREQVEADIREALLDVKMGRTRPIDQLIMELRSGNN